MIASVDSASPRPPTHVVVDNRTLPDDVIVRVCLYRIIANASQSPEQRAKLLQRRTEIDATLISTQAEMCAAIAHLASTLVDVQTVLHGAVVRLESACRKRKEVDLEIETCATDFIDDVADHRAVCDRSAKRAKLRSVHRPYASVVEHPTMFGFVNDARRGIINVTPNELAELAATEKSDEQRIAASTKQLERYEMVRSSLRRAWVPPDAAELLATRTSVDALEWLVEFANNVLDANKL